MEHAEHAAPHPVLDRSPTEPERPQLIPGDDAVLLGRHQTDEPIDVEK